MAALSIPAAAPTDRLLKIALATSIALHAIALSVHFKLPEKLAQKSAVQLDIVLVNSKHDKKPEKAQARAQANLDGGGDTDQNRRAKTPLPVLSRQERGDDVARAQARVRELEQQQRELLARAQKPEPTPVPVPAPVPEKKPVEQEVVAPVPNGQDLAVRALAMARLEAQIARQHEEYNKRPRKKNIGASTEEYRFAQYVEDWRLKIERVGNLNYPADARGRVYGSLRMTVQIRADGTVDRVEVDRPSGYQVLDRAAERIVKLASPFAPFPPNIRRDFELLEITRTWIFSPGDKLQSE